MADDKDTQKTTGGEPHPHPYDYSNEALAHASRGYPKLWEIFLMLWAALSAVICVGLLVYMIHTLVTDGFVFCAQCN